MRPLKCRVHIDQNHKALVDFPTDITPGEIEIILLLPEEGAPVVSRETGPEDECEDLLSASESTFDFWDNPIDDEVWNLA